MEAAAEGESDLERAREARLLAGLGPLVSFRTHTLVGMIPAGPQRSDSCSNAQFAFVPLFSLENLLSDQDEAITGYFRGPEEEVAHYF